MKTFKSDQQIACDKQSAREVDEQGFLHVKDCNISKACVSPYWGAEIPNYEQLGLDPQKTYYLFRDPKELAKAADTFNNLPLMDNHVAVSAFDLEDPKIKKRIMGSTGTDAKFQDPYLTATLVVWTASGIEGVMSKEQTELSCAYRYELDQTPGEFNGEKYDFRMYDIRGNHVALVDEGRAGPDVVVKDRKQQPRVDMKKIQQMIADAIHPVAQNCVDDFIDRLTALKAEITKKLKPGAEEEDAKCLDDCTSAIDLAVHHLLDYVEDQDESGSMTEDENPEGHNQYAGAAGHASSAAGHASAKAIKSKDAGSHEEASAAHAHAASQSKNPATKGWHEKMASAHEAAARGVPVKFGRNFGDNPKVSGQKDHHGKTIAEHSEDLKGAKKDLAKAKADHAQVARATQMGAGKFIPSAKEWKQSVNAVKEAREKHNDIVRKIQAHPDYAPKAHDRRSVTESGSMTSDDFTEPIGTDKIEHRPGHKSSKGQSAPWVIVSETSGKVIWSGPSKEAAAAQLRNIEGHKAGAKDETHGHFAGELSGSGSKVGKVDKENKAREDQRAARAATREAHSKGTVAAHTTAASLHSVASKSLQQAGHNGESLQHAAQADYHRKEASKPFKASHDRSMTCDIEEREDVSPKSGKSAYGNVKFADQKNKKYPIDTPEHVRAAATYWGQAKNKSQYSKEDQDTITNHINAAKKKFKIGEFAESK